VRRPVSVPGGVSDDSSSCITTGCVLGVEAAEAATPAPGEENKKGNSGVWAGRQEDIARLTWLQHYSMKALEFATPCEYMLLSVCRHCGVASGMDSCGVVWTTYLLKSKPRAFSSA